MTASFTGLGATYRLAIRIAFRADHLNEKIPFFSGKKLVTEL